MFGGAEPELAGAGAGTAAAVGVVVVEGALRLRQ